MCVYPGTISVTNVVVTLLLLFYNAVVWMNACTSAEGGDLQSQHPSRGH